MAIEPKAIADACAEFNRPLALQLSEELAKEIRAGDEPYPAQLALAALKPLRRKRFFDIALDLADAVFESGQTDPLARTFYAQALIDTGQIAAAIAYIESPLGANSVTGRARIEAEGLLGRAYKQLYVNGEGNPAKRRTYLDRSFNAYYSVYAAKPAETWHGINAVALYHRANDLPLPDAGGTAQSIYDDMTAQIAINPNCGGWAYATAGEAALALGDLPKAFEWYSQYAADAGNDAFEIASSLRQLVEVWRLTDDKSPGTELLSLLRGALMKRQGGALGFESTGDASAALESVQKMVRQPGLEKTFGVYGAETMKWWKTALERGRAVCRIESLFDEEMGTGFLVRGGDFHKTLGDEPLVLTNHHVVSAGSAKAQARFEEIDRDTTYPCALVWSDASVDATLLRFSKETPKVETLPLAEGCPKRTKNHKPPIPRVYVIGHPHGRTLKISFVDNELVATDGQRLHYRTSTEPGSSGSPVFDERWLVVGLHHKGLDEMENLYGGKPYPANEAYWIGEVRDRAWKSTIK
jgi:tetratricopeptide (TPR) repeat protein